MSESGVAALDHTVQETNVWLRAIVDKLHLDNRHQAYSALRAVLHTLRDRLTPDNAVHLGAQFPMLVRGIYYEGWHMAGKPTNSKSVADFGAEVERHLPPQFPMDPMTVTRGIFHFLADVINHGEIVKVINQLPVPLRSLWPEEVAHGA